MVEESDDRMISNEIENFYITRYIYRSISESCFFLTDSILISYCEIFWNGRFNKFLGLGTKIRLLLFFPIIYSI